MGLDKIKFTERFKSRLPLRLHMTCILMATGLSGLLTTRGLLAAGVEDIVIRYPLAVFFSYLIFFLLIKLWLTYLAIAPVRQVKEQRSLLGDVLSKIRFPSGGGSGSFSRSGGSFVGGGGQFSGGGASGTFAQVGAIITGGPGNAAAETTGNALSEAAGNAAGDAAGGLLDGEGGVVAMVVLAVLGAVVAVVLGAGIYMIYDAPFILSEAAFQVVLAASLAKSSRTMNEPDWIGSVFRTTWKPFGISLLVAWFGALVIHAYYPEVTRISELVRRLLG